ncbi:MAG: GNAT family N-acetyltransferase [Oscillospiraceae bacterium]|nr:GNAT family N-acetyltransferase [Oscillospiraceae bacterium]
MEFRKAERGDGALILGFINELAVYEHMEDLVTATPELLEEQIFDRNGAEVLFVLEDGKEVGFALFFHNFSTFLGRRGLYLEDLFVKPEYRGRGYGKGLILQLAAIAQERGCGRFEWVCLDWNTPSLDFYHALGAERLDSWVIHRVSGDTLGTLAEQAKNG